MKPDDNLPNEIIRNGNPEMTKLAETCAFPAISRVMQWADGRSQWGRTILGTYASRNHRQIVPIALRLQM